MFCGKIFWFYFNTFLVKNLWLFKEFGPKFSIFILFKEFWPNKMLNWIWIHKKFWIFQKYFFMDFVAYLFDFFNTFNTLWIFNNFFQRASRRNFFKVFLWVLTDAFWRTSTQKSQIFQKYYLWQKNFDFFQNLPSKQKT